MKEHWKRIDSDGEYEISNQGRLRRVIDGSLAESGYRKYLISQNGQKKRVFAHRLVAQYFLNKARPLRPEEVVDHLNGNKDDNRAQNLRVTTIDINNENLRPVREAIKADILGKLREQGVDVDQCDLDL